MSRTLNETFSVFHISPKRQRFLEQVLEKCGSISRKEKLKDLGKTRWVERDECFIIGCTLPESSAEAEHSFPGLQRIKSYLRNRMTEKRLSGLALMYLHHDLNIDIDDICTAFVAKRKERMFQRCILYE